VNELAAAADQPLAAVAFGNALLEMLGRIPGEAGTVGLAIGWRRGAHAPEARPP
jgi:hypothetical protein